MSSTVELQAALLQRTLKEHRDHWYQQCKNCQPLIAPYDKAPSFLRYLGSQFSASRHLILSNVREHERVQSSLVKNAEGNKLSAVNVRMEVEGTPLEAPFTEEEIDLLNCKLTALNLNFYPLDKFSSVPMSFARNVMMWYNMALHQEKELKQRNLIPLVVICHEDIKTVAKSPCFFGIASKNSANDTTMSGQYFGHLDPSQMKSTRSEFFTSISSNGVGMPPSKIVTNSLKAEFLQQTVQLGSTKQNADCKTDCFFVRMVWNNSKDLNADIPLIQCSDTNASIEITLQKNLNLWLSGTIWEEIELLRELCNLQLSDHIDPDLYLPAVTGEPTTKSLDEILNSSIHSFDEEADITCLESLFAIVSSGQRQCTDFSDAVWNILKYEGNTQKIAHQFENIFKHCVSTDYELHPNNKSEVASLARELFQTKDATLITVPSVEKTVLYLLEIGFLKVQRDLQFIALNSQLLISLNMEKALDCPEWKDKITMLSQIHQSFEVVLRAKKWLHMEGESLTELFSACLKVPFLETIDVKIPAIHLSHILKCYQPVVRNWKWLVQRGATMSTYSFLASEYPIFSWTENKENADLENEAPGFMEAKYYCALLTQVTRNLKAK